MTDSIGVGMAGYAFMGRAHAHAWRTVAHVFDVPLEPKLVAVAGRDGAAAAAAAQRLGFAEGVAGWEALVARDEVGLVDVCTPGSSHADIAIAALERDKHVLCEKPLGNTLAESEAMAAAADAAAVRSGAVAMVGFNYRRVPAIELARRLIAAGRLGDVRQVRAAYLQDWGADASTPLVWRFVREQAGTGALGDLGAHVVDLAQHLAGDDIASVSALVDTFVRERPLPDGSGTGTVTVDDTAAVIARFAGGATGSFEVTRLARGRKNALRIEVNGADGSLAFDLERPSELEVLLPDDPGAPEGFRRVLVTEPGDPWLEAWWPPGHVLGWDATFVHEVHDLLEGIAAGRPVAPTFADGLQVDRVLAAIGESAAERRWTDVAPRKEETR